MTIADGRPYTPATLAAEWGCSAQHVRNLINRGDLRAFRPGPKLFRIPADAVEEFLITHSLPYDDPQKKSTKQD